MDVTDINILYRSVQIIIENNFYFTIDFAMQDSIICISTNPRKGRTIRKYAK